MNYNFNFKEMSVLITGAASGIGLESTVAFLQNGADVYMLDNNEENLKNAAEKLSSEYPNSKIITICCDITKDEDRNNIAVVIKNNTGKVDILVNNAGMSHSSYSINETKDGWDKVIELNLTSQFFIAQLIAKEFMIPAKKGKIVNMCSLSAIMGLPSAVAYSASKGGFLQLTKSLAAEWARFNIQVNCLCPGFVETPLIKSNLSDENWLSYMKSRTPAKRLAKPDDVAGSVLFLSSQMADFITGTSIVIDGGFSGT